MVELAGFSDVSDILRAGVYALVKRGVVIYVGKSKSLYARIYTHRTVNARANRGKAIPTWLPVKGFSFDQVFVKPCTLEALDDLEREMIERYKPRFNMSLKSAGVSRAPIAMLINGVALALNAPQEPFERRV